MEINEDSRTKPPEQGPSAVTDVIATANSGFFISASQVQSIDISNKFTMRKTVEGWRVDLLSGCKVTINLTTSLRKIEVSLVEGDVIERRGTDVMIFRMKDEGAYKPQRANAPLARSREELTNKEQN